MSPDVIISCKELSENLSRKDWVIVDCRFDLMTPDWGQEEFQALHIPGAVYADLDRDLSGLKTPSTGRHPLPEPADFCSAMSSLGIDEHTRVIAYDATSGSFAARLWFMLRLHGHTNVSILDGGFIQWHKQGYAIESGDNQNAPLSFTGSPNMEMIVTTSQMEKIHTDPEWLVIDARTPERYRGEQEPIDPVAGHIPGAVCRFHGENVGVDGLFHSPETLKSAFTELTKGHDPRKVAIYCGSGVTSCHHLVAMAYAGLPQPKLYVGSWSEWIRDPHHPIAIQ
jgi:thiosulfate/3-mercaptopyruvate sulfurtransferase